MRISGFEVYRTELPFRSAFSHAKSRRKTSASVFVRCLLEDGGEGFGESLPRAYVTGETPEIATDLLVRTVMPRFVGMDFADYASAEVFCSELYEFLGAQIPGLPKYYGATCCALELALLDAYGRAFGRGLADGAAREMTYSGVISSGSPPAVAVLAARYRAAGIRNVKLKVGTDRDRINLWLSRHLLGKGTAIRVDANASWKLEQALRALPKMQSLGVNYFEQPLAVGELANMRTLHERTGARLIADEDLRDVRDAERLIAGRACQVFNIRLSKVGGFFNALKIGKLARDAGLEIQIGCQVGESALLSSAGLAAARRLAPVTFAEGFFGTYLLREDIALGFEGQPIDLRFTQGGRPPMLTEDRGLGVRVNAAVLERYAVERKTVGLTARRETEIDETARRTACDLSA